MPVIKCSKNTKLRKNLNKNDLEMGEDLQTPSNIYPSLNLLLSDNAMSKRHTNSQITALGYVWHFPCFSNLNRTH